MDEIDPRTHAITGERLTEAATRKAIRLTAAEAVLLVSLAIIAFGFLMAFAAKADADEWRQATIERRV